MVECIECKAYFELPDKEKQWYEDKKLFIPKRCKDCRRSKRNMGLKVNFREFLRG